MYIARLYEKTIGGKNVYSRKLIRIARAVFIVLYNGKEEFPDSKILKLSDMFEDATSLGISATNPALELFCLLSATPYFQLYIYNYF